MLKKEEKLLAYITGLALGDGNLSNPNRRAVRLRISCDLKYPNLIRTIADSLRSFMPRNKVNIINIKRNCKDISCYSNKWESLLGWKTLGGSKEKQGVSVPTWIMKKEQTVIECLRGLFQTDGSIYIDRGYKMVNFVSMIPNLARDVMKMLESLSIPAHLYKIKTKGKIRYNIRISKNTDIFIKLIKLVKD